MRLVELFKQDIARPIEIVITADSTSHLKQEIEEYVITEEIAKKIDTLFAHYTDYQGENGVWISGFYGSGKSHLLKMLSLVLQDYQIECISALTSFQEKINDNEILKANIGKVKSIPSESILFNIENFSAGTEGYQNPILPVFLEVFYNHLGFYGFQPHIAEFEMWLDEDGKYEEFKELFKSHIKEGWKEKRNVAFLPDVNAAIAKSLSEIYQRDVSDFNNILNEFQSRQRPQIDDFVKKVKAYIGKKPKGFRLNFFVDEVGQYIGNDIGKMLSFQTITERLKTECNGSSWIFATAQQDLEGIIGDLSKKMDDNYARIQARLNIPIPLTSANVDEVVEKRLLEKNEEGKNELMALYKRIGPQLENNLNFSKTGIQFKGYQNDESFVLKYPLVPYQFDAFQNVMISLSKHDVFTGRYTSTGERTLLEVAQKAIKSRVNEETNILIPFDAFYDGIVEKIKAQVQNPINTAINQMDDPYAIRILKALFLVKYFNAFNATERNIATLLIDHVEIDMQKHTEKVSQALSILESQSYIQRNGELYEFLTDAEKDVETEIKNTDIENSALDKLMYEIFFGEIIRDNKLPYEGNRQSYNYSQKIDGKTNGREHELGIDIVTPNHPNYENENFLLTQSMGAAVMVMKLKNDPIFLRDAKLYLKTEKYIRINQSNANSTQVESILRQKQRQNVEERLRNLKQLAQNMLANSPVFINGSQHQIHATQDPKSYVIKAFQNLVQASYTQIRMIGETPYTENTVSRILQTPTDELFDRDDQTISAAETEILNYLKRQVQMAERSHIRSVINHFASKPYGWYENAVLAQLARLFKRGKIEFNLNGNLLEAKDLQSSVFNTAQQSSTLIDLLIDYNQQQINRLKEVYQDAFDRQSSETDAKSVAKDFLQQIQLLKEKVNGQLEKKTQYHFLEELTPLNDLLTNLSNKGYKYFLENLSDFEDELLDNKEDYWQPVQQFMHSPQLQIYNDLQTLIHGNTSNLDYVEGSEMDTIKTLLNSKTPYSGNGLQLAKSAKDSLQNKIIQRISEEKQACHSKLSQALETLKSNPDFSKLSEDHQKSIAADLEELKKDIDENRYIANLMNLRNSEIDRLLTALLTRSNTMYREKQQEETGKAAEPAVTYIHRTKVYPDVDFNTISTENEVDLYVEALRKKMKEMLNDNKKIQL